MLIKNGIIGGRLGWLRVENGRIEAMGEGAAPNAEEVIDAKNALVLPGVIDDHVHFREPGMEHKGTIASESRAAAAGGVTSILDMPNNAPPTTSRASLEAKIEIAARDSMVNFGFWLGATTDNIKEIAKADPTLTAGVKVFMGSSTGGMLVDDAKALSAIFAESPLLVGVHCEDEGIIKANAARIKAELGDTATAAVHPLVRTAEACYRSTARAVELADRYGTNLHVLHLTTARELQLFDNKPISEKKITAEACAHHLWFCDEDYGRLGNLIKVNPAIKTSDDRAALREAVLNGRIDLIATDHAPHTLMEKQRGYWDAPSGAPAIEHSLCQMLELFPVETVVEKMCAAPAARFGLRDRGVLRVGAAADIVIVRQREQVVGDVHYKCDWSPLAGTTLQWSVERTIIGGRTVFLNGEFDEDFRGEALKFN